LWIPEEVGCRLQEGVPQSKSGTAQEERLQENSDLRNWGYRIKFAAAGMMTRREKWHDAGNTGFRDKEKTTLHREPEKDGEE
jgi:hypothetical protein